MYPLIGLKWGDAILGMCWITPSVMVQPTSWKGYTIGDPLAPQTTKYPWRLVDEAVMGPFYDKIAKAGITTGLYPQGPAANGLRYLDSGRCLAL